MLPAVNKEKLDEPERKTGRRERRPAFALRASAVAPRTMADKTDWHARADHEWSCIPNRPPFSSPFASTGMRGKSFDENGDENGKRGDHPGAI